jgi:hypothetical protein
LSLAFSIQCIEILGDRALLFLRISPVDLAGRHAVIAAGIGLHHTGIDGKPSPLPNPIAAHTTRCTLTAISPNGPSNAMMSCSTTLSRVGDVYSVAAGTVAGSKKDHPKRPRLRASQTRSSSSKRTCSIPISVRQQS